MGNASHLILPVVGAVAGTILFPGVGTAAGIGMGTAGGAAAGMLADTLVNPQKMPSMNAPTPNAPPVIPTMDTQAVQQAQQSASERMQLASGRLSTIMSAGGSNDKLGG